MKAIYINDSSSGNNGTASGKNFVQTMYADKYRDQTQYKKTEWTEETADGEIVSYSFKQ